MDATTWDERYASTDLVWSADPTTWVAELAADLPPGRVLDLAGGEGRNSLWLAERGWRATVVDYSRVALDRARDLARQRLGDAAVMVRTEEADLLTYVPHPLAFDLVLVVYLHIPPDERRIVLRNAAVAVAPSGLLMVIGHDTENLISGVGGPQDPAVLYTPADISEDLAGTGLEVVRAEAARRSVEVDTDPRSAIDAIVVAMRPMPVSG